MTPITTVRAQLPCPTCGVVGARTLAVRAPAAVSELIEAGSSRGLPGGLHEGRLSECSACWSRRARLVAAARRRLRETGHLSSLGPGLGEAWMGVPIERCEESFLNAFESEMLRAALGEPLPPRVGLSRVELAPARQEDEQPEPEPVGV